MENILKFLFFTTLFISYTKCLDNTSPVIGILSQETYIVDSYFPNETHDAFIAASYVKFLESSGARVLPIWIGQDESYYERVVQYTNGIFFPGGGTYFNESKGYGEAATIIYKHAVDLNDKGVYYPLWGTCLGLQVLIFAALKGELDIRVNCQLKHVSIPLDFESDFKNSRLFKEIPDDILNILKTENVTYNLHSYCITKDVLNKYKLSNDWTVMSTNLDANNFEFVSTMEHTKYPFYGVQFHPEKNQFEFKKNAGFAHSLNATKVGQFLSNFFVEESRKNENSFPNDDIEIDSLIYNFNPRYTGKNNSYYEQIYVFDKSDFEHVQLL